MITEKQFFQRLRQVAARRPAGDLQTLENVFDMVQIAWYRGDEGHLIYDIENYDEFHDRPDNFPKLMKHPGLAYFFDLTDSKVVLEDDTFTDNWVYDRPTKTLLVNLKRGSHEGLTSHLYEIHKGERISIGSPDNSESYLNEGLGFFLSSASSFATKGEGIRLNAQEKIIFKTVKFWESRNG